MKLTHISLFSGIGGIDLAAEWAGFETILFVEIDKYCQRVLRKHWPNVPIIGDIKDVKGNEFEDTTLISGGFPCQDISSVKYNPEGIDGEKSGLWGEYKRLVSKVRPKYVIVENVSALLFRGVGRVLGDLSEIGYDAEWRIVQASDYGAQHQRKRLFIIAYPQGFRWNPLDIQQKDGCTKEYIQSSVTFRGLCSDLSMVMEPNFSNPRSGINRNDDGISPGLDRLKCLGNAVVPQQIYPILKAIARIENETRTN